VVAALVAALAATLAAAAADRSREVWDEAGGARAQAHSLRGRAVSLAERDADTYAAARLALAERGIDIEPGDDPEQQRARDWRLGRAVMRAAKAPAELAASAADIAELAREIAARGAYDIRVDAVIAASLAAAAARAAAQLVEVNLVVGGDQEPAVRARTQADAAAAAAASAASGVA
jgi:formiminotetrahydrofolate cyclodeaminase